ncbi:MAG: MFS transporter, partial [Bacteroidetes bacterium]
MKNQQNSSLWAWIPSLYYTEGLPYVMVMTVSVILYKRLGVSNTEIALYTSWLYLPWVIKPLWSPLVDLFKTKRFWIAVMQLLVGAGFAGVALTIPTEAFFQYTLAFFWLVAFSSATHDIAADGFYLLALETHKQAYFVGIRSTFYRLAMVTGQGLIVILAGFFEVYTGIPKIEFQVESTKNIVQNIDLNNLKTDFSSHLTIKSSAEKISIQILKIDSKMADSVLKMVRSQNIVNNFYQAEKIVQKTGENPSFWKKNVSEPLENTLKNIFSVEKKEKKTDQSGNIGLMYFYLSAKPSQKTIVNLNQISGDKSIFLAEGSRFEFDETNWNKPALSAFRLDSKLQNVVFATFEASSGNIPLAWTITFIILGIMMAFAGIYHQFILPKPATDLPVSKESNPMKSFFKTFILFFQKPNIAASLTFLLFYRFSESQLVKLASPFLLDSKEVGGLGLTTGEVGLVYGTIGIISLTVGGILGGLAVSKKGLKYWFWTMAAAINLPNATYIYLAYSQTDSFLLIAVSVAIEQFGYGFGFTAYMLYTIYISEGEHKTS